MTSVAAKVGIAVSLVAAAGASAAAVYLAIEYARAGTVRHVLRRSPAMQNGRYTVEALTKLARDANEIRFLDARGVPPVQVNNNGRPRVAQSIPTSARQVPLLPPTNTPLVPDGFNRLTGPGRRKWILAVREVLRAAGFGDVDARIIAQRWAVETAWDRACQQRNRGNVKAQGYGVYVESWATLVSAQRVWLNNIPEAVGIHGLTDRVSSADYYPSFAADAEYARFFMRTIGRFGDALAQARRGGLEGARGFAAALARGGYSPGSVAEHVSEMEGYWRNGERLMGAATWESLR